MLLCPTGDWLLWSAGYDSLFTMRRSAKTKTSSWDVQKWEHINKEVICIKTVSCFRWPCIICCMWAMWSSDAFLLPGSPGRPENLRQRNRQSLKCKHAKTLEGHATRTWAATSWRTLSAKAHPRHLIKNPTTRLGNFFIAISSCTSYLPIPSCPSRIVISSLRRRGWLPTTMPTIQELDTTVRAFYEGRGEQVG